MIKRLTACIGILVLLFGCANKANEETKFVEELLAKMTFEEKLGQMTLYSSGEDPTVPVFNPKFREEVAQGRCGAIFASVSVDSIRYLQSLAVNSRLGIPMMFGYDVIHGFETIMPIPLAEAASWNMSLITQGARSAAEEASANGINWLFGPMIDVTRDARWGRVSEGAGEDPYLVSQVAKAKVNGYQRGDLRDRSSVAACAKHFAAYGMPVAGKDYNTVIVSEQELNDVYLPPFQAAVEQGCATIMCAFNEINGTPSTSNKELLTETLQNRWGFSGFVVTDFASIRELMNHGVAADEYQCADLALNAGVHMDMEAAIYNDNYATKQQTKQIDDAVRRILRVKYRLGLFDDPYKYCAVAQVDKQRSKENALNLAQEAIVLVKNNKSSLPINLRGLKVALIGPLADNQADHMGTWIARGKADDVVTIRESLSRALDYKGRIQYAKGCDIDTQDRSGFAEAVSAAKKSDIVVVVLGEKGDMAGEAASRGDITLPGVQTELLAEIYKTGKKVIVVISNGRPLALTRESEMCDAMLIAWQLGTMTGDAITNVITGKVNPSGKLPITFPICVGQVPIHYSHKSTGRPADSQVRYTSRYLDIPFAPLFPFGYGLSYTQFAYSDVEVLPIINDIDKPLTISCTVKNIGERDGKEVVQLYIQDVNGSVTRPVRELKGFCKIELKAGTKKRVTFEITPSKDLVFTNQRGERVVEKGAFRIFVGGDSTAELSSEFELK